MNRTTENYIDDDERREVAYHEAGHASMHWLFGTVSDLGYIAMNGNAVHTAFVRSRRTNVIGLIESCDPHDRAAVDRATLKAQQVVMYSLAGMAAESRVEYVPEFAAKAIAVAREMKAQLGFNTPLWFYEVASPQELEIYEGEHDFDKAHQVAQALYGDSGKCWEFLERMAVWTDEALSHPRMWAVVEALAERLQTIKTRLSAQAAIKIMSAAWGESTGLPYLQIGPDWEQRFPVKTDG